MDGRSGSNSSSEMNVSDLSTCSTGPSCPCRVSRSLCPAAVAAAASSPRPSSPSPKSSLASFANLRSFFAAVRYSLWFCGPGFAHAQCATSFGILRLVPKWQTRQRSAQPWKDNKRVYKRSHLRDKA